MNPKSTSFSIEKTRELLLAAGPYPASLLPRFPDWENFLFRETVLDRLATLSDFRNRLEQDPERQRLDPADFLRRFHAREILRIGFRVIENLAPNEETSSELAFLAEAICEAAVQFAQEEVERKWGSASPEAKGYFLFGMGKLGGRELNFSSDIDLIPFYRTDRGTVLAPDGTPSEGNLHQYYTRITETWIRLLGEVTAQGFVYRIDLRLRPEGTRGPLVNSMKSAEQYYETWGTLWERASYLKARPIAGDKTLGIQLLRALEPFVYRRHLDFHVLEEMRRLKLLIAQEQNRKTTGQIDLKLGPGGIREIEFFVQTHQLIHGGRETTLRSPSTLTALENMQHLGLVKENDAQDLSAAYTFLRRAEDLLQFYDNQQTHLVPNDGPALTSLVRFMNEPTAAHFLATLQSHRNRVHALFESLLEETSPIRETRFVNTQKTQEVLVLLYQNWNPEKSDHPTLALLQQTAGLFGAHLERLPDWRRYLRPLEHLFRGLGRNSETYTFLANHPEVLEQLMALLRESDFLTELLLERPNLLSLLSAINSQTPGIHNLPPALDRGEAMERCRILKKQTLFQVAFSDLFEKLSLAEVQSQLTEFAETTLDEASRLIFQELTVRYGQPKSVQKDVIASCAVVGLGTLGAGELSYRSDLDLIFIYDEGGETDGTRTVTNQEFFTLFAQRLLSFLTTATASGTAYSIDTRLRPSGNAGTLVTSRETFLRYHQEKSQIWEIQALLRARPIVGSEEFRTQLQEDFSKLIFQQRNPQTVAHDLHQMRLRIQDERSQSSLDSSPGIDLKTGSGGLTDLEFATHYLQLKNQGPAQTHTRKALQALSGTPGLPSGQAQVLIHAYDQYRHLTNRLCLVCNRNIDTIHLGLPRLDEVARSLSHEDGRSLIESLLRTAQEVRKIYLDILEII